MSVSKAEDPEAFGEAIDRAMERAWREYRKQQTKDCRKIGKLPECRTKILSQESFIRF